MFFCYNEEVVKNVVNSERTLKKKHNSIAYHRTFEGISVVTIIVSKEDVETNLIDLLTKLLDGPRLRKLKSRILW